MKIKIFFICLVTILVGISISQIFSIPPYEDDIYPYYESSYFSELEKGFDYIKNSFLYIKMYSKKPEYAWVFINEIRKKEKINIQLYDRKGYEVFAPGKKSKKIENEVVSLLTELKPEKQSKINLNHFSTIIPIEINKECLFCHRTNRKNKIIGAFVFKRQYNGRVYYSAERIIIFIIISIILVFLLFLLFQWDPEQNIKELFDKT